MILVPTIPHTGTHFVRDHLLAGHEIRCQHVWAGAEITLGRLAMELPTIVPLRRPEAVAASWRRRYKNLADLPAFYERLALFIDPADPFYLPLDSEDRDDYLQRINDGFGLNLTTDWRIVRGDEEQDAITPRPTEEPIARQIWHTHSELLGRFYEPLR